MDSNNSKKNALYDFILKLVKSIGAIFRGLKIKSTCCNSECMNKDTTINNCPESIVPLDQKEESLK